MPASSPKRPVATGNRSFRALAHTPAKPGAGSASGAGCNVNKWVFSHAAGPTELPVRQISVRDWNSTSRAPCRRPAYQFQCNCIGTCTRIWTCRCRTTVLNIPVCMKPTRCWLQSAKIIILYFLSFRNYLFFQVNNESGVYLRCCYINWAYRQQSLGSCKG